VFLGLPAAGLYAYTAQALTTRPVSLQSLTQRKAITPIYIYNRLLHNIGTYGFRLAVSYKKKADGIKVPSAFLFY
jgi:hypothetical protein